MENINKEYILEKAICLVLIAGSLILTVNSLGNISYYEMSVMAKLLGSSAHELTSVLDFFAVVLFISSAYALISIVTEKGIGSSFFAMMMLLLGLIDALCVLWLYSKFHEYREYLQGVQELLNRLDISLDSSLIKLGVNIFISTVLTIVALLVDVHTYPKNETMIPGTGSIYCPNCNTPNDHDAKHCFMCGAKLERIPESIRACPHCGMTIPMGSKFCGGCGKAIEVVTVNRNWTCKMCGQSNSNADNYCTACGTSRCERVPKEMPPHMLIPPDDLD